MITVENVTFSHDPGHLEPAVKNASLTIEQGAHLALLGSNGSGKSTLARMLNGLVIPQSGKVLVDSQDTKDPKELAQLRRKIQMVFQNPENQQVGVTVYEDIAFGLANFGVPTAHMKQRAIDALQAVNFDVPLDRELSSLSGGELQRVALASVLALKPEYLIVDEATSMLDPHNRSVFLQTLETLRVRDGITIIHITHHLDEIENATDVVVMKDGVLTPVGTPQDLFSKSDLLDEYGLIAPYEWRDETRVPHINVRAGLQPALAETAPHTRATASAIPALELQGVSVDYANASIKRKRASFFGRKNGQQKSAHYALDNLNISVARGEMLAIAGRSGAGKTTLISTLKGLLRPALGNIAIDGLDAWAEGNRRDARRLAARAFDGIGYVFQYPEHQLFATTVFKDVAYGLQGRGLTEDQISAKVTDALAAVGMGDPKFLERSPFELSGGQKRRVAIAGVLVTEPKIVLFDEPTAGMDVPSRRAFFELLKVLQVRGVTLLWISHQHEEILEHADRVLVLEKGRVVADGRPYDVLQDEAILELTQWPLLAELDPHIEYGGKYLRARGNENYSNVEGAHDGISVAAL